MNAISKKRNDVRSYSRRTQPAGAVFRSSSLSAFFYGFDFPPQFHFWCSIETSLKTADKNDPTVFDDINDTGSFLYSGKW